MRIGTYDVVTANIPHDPVWPTMPFNELLRVAFRNHVIDSLDHPALRRLRGEE